VEIQQKQIFLDEAHAKLKDKTHELRDTRRKLHLLKEQTTTFEDLHKQAKNLEHAIGEEELRFSNSSQGTKGPDNATTINDAEENTMATSFTGPFDADAPMTVQPLGADMATPLPPTPILRTRVVAYKKNNAGLRRRVEGLLYTNKLAEDKIKFVVSKCAGVALNQLDALLEALLQAVDSDGPALDQNELMAFVNHIPRGV
jgi:regulatory protein SWI6